MNVVTIIVMGLFLVAQGVGARPDAEPAAPSAASQTVISYQGTLTDKSGNPLDQTVTMEFALYDAATGGNRLWGPETQSVQVSEGTFHVLLGSVTPIDPIDFTSDLYLNTKVNGEPLAPRERLTSIVSTVQASLIDGDLDMRDHRIENLGIGPVNFSVGDATGGGNAHFTLYEGDQFAFRWIDDQGEDHYTLLVGKTEVDVRLPLNVHGNDITNVDGIQLPFKLESDRPWEFRAYDSGQYTKTALRSTGDRKEFQFRNPNDSVILSILASNATGGRLDLNGHSITNCGALTEANLQTKEELAAERIDRFEEGDLLCWAGERLEKCTTAGDPLVQAVADAEGRPIVIGAELVKVVGPVRYGDLLVASDAPGYAMVDNDPRPGAVIAQALEDFDPSTSSGRGGEMGIIKAMIQKF